MTEAENLTWASSILLATYRQSILLCLPRQVVATKTEAPVTEHFERLYDNLVLSAEIL